MSLDVSGSGVTSILRDEAVWFMGPAVAGPGGARARVSMMRTPRW
jgi:hypothetical protein